MSVKVDTANMIENITEFEILQAMYKNISSQLQVKTKDALYKMCYPYNLQVLKHRPQGAFYYSGKGKGSDYDDQKNAHIYMIFIFSVFGFSFFAIMISRFIK